MKETDNKLLTATFDTMIECLCTFYETLTLISSELYFTSTGGIKKRIFQTGTCQKKCFSTMKRDRTPVTLC